MLKKKLFLSVESPLWVMGYLCAMSHCSQNYSSTSQVSKKKQVVIQ